MGGGAPRPGAGSGGPRSRMIATAWAKDRPQKRPGSLAHEDGLASELADAGYDPRAVLADAE